VLAALVLLHALVIWALLQAPGIREAIAGPAEVTVRLLPAKTPAPATTPPRELAVATLPVPAVPRIEAPSVELAPEPRVETQQPVAVLMFAPPASAPAAPPPPAPEPAPTPRTVAITEVAYLTPPAPEYPMASVRLRERGTVQLRVLVDAQGRPQQVLTARSSGHPRLDAAAAAAVHAARFKPYTENGRPLPFWVVVPIAFE
jgi:periplasmic protein TonB